MHMRTAFFHGLESKPFSEKNQILIEQYGDANVYAQLWTIGILGYLIQY